MSIRKSSRSTASGTFVIALASCSLMELTGMTTVSAESVATVASVTSPLRIPEERMRESRGPAIELTFDEASYLELDGRDRVTLTDFVLPGRARMEAPRQVELQLERMRVLGDGAKIAVNNPLNPQEQRELPRPEVSIFRGRIAGEPESRVYLSISPRGIMHGYVIEPDQGMAVLSSGPHGRETKPVIYNPQAIQPGLLSIAPWDCDIAAQADRSPPSLIRAVPEQLAAATSGPVQPPCRRVTVAIETDFEFTQELFDSDMIAAADYVLTLVGAASEIFSNDINVEFEVVYIGLWDEPGGPSSWGGFQNHWNENMTHIERDLAHFFAASGSGGVAMLWGVCDEEFGYAASFGLNGSFPYPLEDFNDQNWDPIVVTHEFGHNFGAPHTHNYCPALDKCSQIGGGLDPTCVDEVVCQDGTIMGYCHLCPGGLSNTKLAFHPVVRMTMLDFLDSITTCELEIEGDCELEEPLFSVVHVPEDAPMIADAFWLVADGGEILVAPGTYTEQLAFTGWYFDAWGDIVLTSKSFHLRSTDGPEVTILDGSGQTGSVLSFFDTGNAAYTVEGFTITGGSAENGGGIHADDADLTVLNCIFEANEAGTGGGAIYQIGGNLHVEDSTFLNNESGWSGGAIFAEHAAVTISTCGFVGNATVPLGVGNGAAIFLWEGVQDSTISGSTFAGNVARWGGAIGIGNIDKSATVAIIDCEFTDNTALESTGGGIAVQSSTATLEESSFFDNFGRFGGAVGGVAGVDGAHIDLSNCQLINNEGEFDGGGFALFDATGSLFEVTIDGNTAERGGGVALLTVDDEGPGSFAFINASVISNNTSLVPGGGIFIGKPGLAELSNTALCGNVPDVIDGMWTDLGGNSLTTICIKPGAADLNGDGVVDVLDLLILLENWGACGNPDDCPADLNGDGIVDVLDLLILLENWA